jgi:hypothetical protein
MSNPTGTNESVEFRVMPNGDGRWYWEIILGRDVITRGLSDNEPSACQEASQAARKRELI